jgi:hypothetical protein
MKHAVTILDVVYSQIGHGRKLFLNEFGRRLRGPDFLNEDGVLTAPQLIAGPEVKLVLRFA